MDKELKYEYKQPQYFKKDYIVSDFSNMDIHVPRIKVMLFRQLGGELALREDNPLGIKFKMYDYSNCRELLHDARTSKEFKEAKSLMYEIKKHQTVLCRASLVIQGGVFEFKDYTENHG